MLVLVHDGGLFLELSCGPAVHGSTLRSLGPRRERDRQKRLRVRRGGGRCLQKMGRRCRRGKGVRLLVVC